MEKSFLKILQGYQQFRQKYVLGDESVMQHLAQHGQKPEVMVVACCDSRVDPALICQCDPGDLFVVRNVANIVPPYEKDNAYHGTSAALEFGICFLKVKHLILLGHSQCGGMAALLNSDSMEDDFISNWVSVIKKLKNHHTDVDQFAQQALHQSFKNCLSFPWIKAKVDAFELRIHRWFFDIKNGEISTYCEDSNSHIPLYKNLSENQSIS